MRNFLFSILLFISSCNNNNIIVNHDSNDTLDYKHVWINKLYLDRLNKTKSHSISQKGIRIAFLGYNPYSYNPDEGRFPTFKDTMVIWKFEVGIGYDLQKIDNKYSLKLDTSEHGDEYPKTIGINLISDKLLYMDNDTFEKTSTENLNIIQNKLIIAGKYKYLGTDIDIDTIGFVKGIDKFNHYRLILNPNQDIIDIGAFDWCIYKFYKDTLKIYRCKCLKDDAPRSFDCIKCDTGELIYELEKTTHNTAYAP